MKLHIDTETKTIWVYGKIEVNLFYEEMLKLGPPYSTWTIKSANIPNSHIS